MKNTDKVYVAGHRGMVGSAIVRKLRSKGFQNIILRSSDDLDLRNQYDVDMFFKRERPKYVFLAAAKVGGIMANNTYRADFIYDNIQIQSNIIHSSFKYEVNKLLFLGSSCIYPKYSKQPISESSLLEGSLEPTNEPYAIAKIAGIKMCQAYSYQHNCDFISIMPTNLFGLGDNYHPENSHVIPGLIRRIHMAKISNSKEVIVWGSGQPKREFLFADDLADACWYLMMNYSEDEIINVGTGKDISIAELAFLIKEVVGFEGEIFFDTSMPDGSPRKLLDISKLRQYGWESKTNLKEGLSIVYDDFLLNYV